MIARRLAIALVLICLACKKPAPQTAKPAEAGPRMRATVVTLKTTTQPGDKTFIHDLVIAGNRARNTGEHDVWHLYDAKAGTITTVDDIAKTIRTEPVQSIVRQRKAALAKTLPSYYPRMALEPTGEKRAIQNVTARQNVIEAGAYRRELWMAEHPSIPKSLFSLMYAAEPHAAPLAPMMRGVDEALLAASGFPLLDRAEIAFGNQKVVVDRSVVSITQRELPQSLLELPKGYQDTTPKPVQQGKKK